MGVQDCPSLQTFPHTSIGLAPHKLFKGGPGAAHLPQGSSQQGWPPLCTSLHKHRWDPPSLSFPAPCRKRLLTGAWNPTLQLSDIPVLVFGRLAGVQGRMRQKDTVRTGRESVNALVCEGRQGWTKWGKVRDRGSKQPLSLARASLVLSPSSLLPFLLLILSP